MERVGGTNEVGYTVIALPAHWAELMAHTITDTSSTSKSLSIAAGLGKTPKREGQEGQPSLEKDSSTGAQGLGEVWSLPLTVTGRGWVVQPGDARKSFLKQMFSEELCHLSQGICWWEKETCQTAQLRHLNLSRYNQQLRSPFSTMQQPNVCQQFTPLQWLQGQ